MAKNGTAPTLDERVAAALAAPDQPSAVFADLIAKVDGAVDDADRTASEARARSVDPAIIDADAHGRAKDAEFVAQRLHNALSALQELHCEAMGREQVAAWRADADAVEAVRDKLAAEMAEKYTAATVWIVEFFQRMAACDQEVSRINGSAPPLEHRRLLGVELAARGIDNFGLNDRPIVETLRLPALVRGYGSAMAWPAPSVPLSVQYASTVRW
jgi:hypothetical protein